MDCKEAIAIFENDTKRSVVRIERCGVGIANYVFIVSTAAEKFVLRCSKDANAYQDIVYWLSKLAACEIPIPTVISQGNDQEYSYLILSYIPGDDLGNVYWKLSDSEKKRIAQEVVEIQRKVSEMDIAADAQWTWNGVIEELLNRAEERIKQNGYFDAAKIHIIRKLQQEIREYLDTVRPIPYLDDISTKNLLIDRGKVSGIIDIDWMGLGDLLTFAAMTKVALLNMDLDTQYVDYLLEEIRPNAAAYKAFLFYCLVYCVDFMGERGMRFLDKRIPVNESVIRRLNNIFDVLMEEWSKCCERKSLMEWTIRRAVKNDKSRINELFIEMIQTIYNEKNADGYEEGYLDHFFDNHEDWICAAEINASVVAYLSIEVHREQEDFLYLDDLSVSEKYRGNGIGTELIKTAERFAEEIGISIITLHVEKSNKSAFRLYRRLGYSAVRDEGTRLRMIKINS